MTVQVWPMPSYEPGISLAAASLLPIFYANGASTEVTGNCLSVFDAAGKPIAQWGSGAWQRTQV
jgi:hypothetical protein